MNVQNLQVSQEVAAAALAEYKAHRGIYDKADWEIERIYRQIARGNIVISVHDAVRRGGVDELGRPRLAIMAADQAICRCNALSSDQVEFGNVAWSTAPERYWRIPWDGRPPLNTARSGYELTARLPRIPPQHRPRKNLRHYQILWEADWTEIPRDPYLLKRIGRDAYIVLAAWELTDVEVNVLRANG